MSRLRQLIVVTTFLAAACRPSASESPDAKAKSSVSTAVADLLDACKTGTASACEALGVRPASMVPNGDAPPGSSGAAGTVPARFNAGECVTAAFEGNDATWKVARITIDGYVLMEWFELDGGWGNEVVAAIAKVDAQGQSAACPLRGQWWCFLKQIASDEVPLCERTLPRCEAAAREARQGSEKECFRHPAAACTLSEIPGRSLEWEEHCSTTWEHCERIRQHLARPHADRCVAKS